MNSVHLTGAGTTTVIPMDSRLPNPPVLQRVVVNSGDDGATVTLQFRDDDEVIAVIDASNPDVGRVYQVHVGDRGLEAVVTGSPDVTIVYS